MGKWAIDFRSILEAEEGAIRTPSRKPVSLNTSTESLKMSAIYAKGRGGVIRIEGKKGPKDYRISVKIPFVYTGAVQPILLEKTMLNGGKSSEYTIWTNVKGQSHTISRKDALQLADLYNSDRNSVTLGSIAQVTFTRTWKWKDL